MAPGQTKLSIFRENEYRREHGRYIGELSGRPAVSKLIVDSHAAGSTSRSVPGARGHLLFLRGTPCWRNLSILPISSFDGEPVAIASAVGGLMPDYAGNPGFSISENGVLAYHSITGARSQLVWLDRSGNRMSSDRHLRMFVRTRVSQLTGNA